MIIAGDFETYYSTEYSLTKLNEVEYILSPEFEVLMLSLKFGDSPSEIYYGRKAIANKLATINWDNVAWLSHNTKFDGAILAWIFGYYPKMYLDTLSMSRATTHWVLGRSSLAKVAEYLGLPAKGTEVVLAKGKHLSDFTRDELRAYGRYCIRDNDLCYAIFHKMRRIFSARELTVIDLIMRMFIQPQVVLNSDILEVNYQQVLDAKAQALAQVGTIPKATFSSNPQFAQLLEDNGVEVPQKLSPRTGELIPALARGDALFKVLCSDDTLPLFVQSLLAARLSVKSTLEETRSRNLLRLSKLDWPATTGSNWAPISLKYSGARTHRLSGDGGLNWQNLPRGSLMRQAVEAPVGYRIVHRDQSQIEARMTAWMAQCDVLLDAFREKRDVYSEFASIVYRQEVTKADTRMRFVGKTAILGLGYGCGPEKFKQMLFIGNGGISVKVDLSMAETIVSDYRHTYPEIVSLWSYTDVLLRDVGGFGGKVHQPYFRNRADYRHIPVEAQFDSFLLPSGLRICYPNLREDPNDTFRGIRGLIYDDAQYKDAPHKIYGAKGVENISQALSRIIVTDIAVRIYQKTGCRPFLTTHDSLDYCVPVHMAPVMDVELERQFAVVPKWCTGLPLASEGGWGRNLAEAERMVNQ